MEYQRVFRRYELKYLLTQQQKERVLAAIVPRMNPDPYGPTTVRNLYFDTDNFRLIRRSLEKPVYKEKLRLRSYGLAAPGSTVFVELKKKYKGVVYKRRLQLEARTAADWLSGEYAPVPDSQIRREIDTFLDFYGTLRPRVFLSYRREAWYSRENGAFRVTFDTDIRCRRTDLTLEAPPGGAPILSDGTVLMEIKCAGGIPLWLTQVLSEEKIRRTPFSKYGTAYQTLIYPEIKEEFRYE